MCTKQKQLIKLLYFVIAFGLCLTGHKLSRTGNRYLNCCLKKYIYTLNTKKDLEYMDSKQ